MLKIKKISLVLGVITSGFFLCNSGFSHYLQGRHGAVQASRVEGKYGASKKQKSQKDQWNPSNRYVMITFDDGFTEKAKEAIKPLMEVLNSDGKPVRMTYFATAGFSGNFANLDWWASKGNEVANHTVTHMKGWGGQTGVLGTNGPDNYNGAYDLTRWQSEIGDMVSILKYWTSITTHQTITGFRAPQLVLNYNTFNGYDAYISKQNPASNSGSIYYDSDIRYYAKDDGQNFKPPQELTQENFCEGTDITQGFIKLTSPYGNCQRMIPNTLKNTIWEVPMPLFADNLMELPSDFNDKWSNYLDDYMKKQDNGDGKFTPMLMPLHPDQAMKHGELKQWMTEAIDKYKVTFVTVGEVIRMYAAQSEDESKPPATYNLTGTPVDCKTPDKSYADSINDGTVETSPYCNLNCNDTSNYGSGCFSHSGKIPGGSDRFQTYNSNKRCQPNSKGQIRYASGAYPWLGNPMGNVNTLTGGQIIEDYCNYFPKVTAPAPISTECTNPKPYNSWDALRPEDKNKIKGGFCVTYSGDYRNAPGVYQCVTCQGAFCKSDSPSIKTIPNY